MESRQLPSPSHDPTTPTHRLSVSGYQCTFHKKPQGSLRSAQSHLSLFRHAGSTDGSEPDSRSLSPTCFGTRPEGGNRPFSFAVTASLVPGSSPYGRVPEQIRLRLLRSPVPSLVLVD
ncbi:unnamed protein product, partial [Nesidiocoris tenuis]